MRYKRLPCFCSELLVVVNLLSSLELKPSELNLALLYYMLDYQIPTKLSFLN